MLIKNYQGFTRQTAIYPGDNKLLYLSNALAVEVGEVADLASKNYSEIQEYHQCPVDIEYLSSEDKSNLILELGDCIWHLVELEQVLNETNALDYIHSSIYLVSVEKDFEEYNDFFRKRIAKYTPLALRIIELVCFTGKICNVAKKATTDGKKLSLESIKNISLNIRMCINTIALIGLVINTNLNEIVENNVEKVKRSSSLNLNIDN